MKSALKLIKQLPSHIESLVLDYIYDLALIHPRMSLNFGELTYVQHIRNDIHPNFLEKTVKIKNSFNLYSVPNPFICGNDFYPMHLIETDSIFDATFLFQALELLKIKHICGKKTYICSLKRQISLLVQYGFLYFNTIIIIFKDDVFTNPRNYNAHLSIEKLCVKRFIDAIHSSTTIPWF